VNNSLYKRHYNRDAKLVNYTILAWSRNSLSFYDSFKESIDNGKIKVIVDTIYYNPEFTKMIAQVVIAYDAQELDSSYFDAKKYNNSISFDGRLIIGYRLDSIQPWNLYPFNPIILGGYIQSEKVKEELTKKLVHSLKDDGEFVNDTLSNKKTFVKYGYNITDSGFWTNSVIWKKGVRVNGLYNFETRGNINRSDPEPMDKKAKVIYPDSILALYKLRR
jgi:hypothetical protein